MIFSFVKATVIFLLLIYSHLLVNAQSIGSGLNIEADHWVSDRSISLTLLEGNVELQHLGMTLTGDSAEIHSASEIQPKLFVISGEPVNFHQKTPTTQLTVSARKIIYSPSASEMNFEDKVSIVQQTSENQFEITASQLQLIFHQGQPEKLSAEGNPIIFSQQLTDRKVLIQAKKIVWEAATQIAILHQATVVEKQTLFSADEIKYNTLTGEISAVGSGNSRPSYRYKPTKKKEISSNNDS